MNAKRVRNIFIFVLILLPLQYMAVGVVGYYKSEPWPAFVFPGFKNIYVYNGLFELPQTYFELYDSEDERISSLKPYQFFPDLPRSQISGFMRTHFQDPDAIENLSEEAKTWLEQNSREISGTQVSRVEITHNIEFYRRNGSSLEIDSVDHQFTAEIQFSDL